MSSSSFGSAVRMRSFQASMFAAALGLVPLTVSAQTAPPRSAAPTAVKPKPAAPGAATAAQAPASGAGQSAAPVKSAGDDVIARVGGTNVSADEIRGYVAALGPRERAAFGQDPSLLSQAVRMMLANRIVLQEVVARKWDQQPGIAEQLDRVRENAVVELYLQSVSTPPAGFPSDDELQKVYDANRAALLMPRQFQLAQIFVALAKDANKAAEDKSKKTVEDIQRKLKAPGADFAAFANDSSDVKNGGDLGWIVESQIRPEIRTAVMELAKSAVSEPIKLDDGWHIIKLVDTKAAYTRTLPEVRDALVQQMRNERASALRRAYLAELVKQHPPVINELALSNLLSEQVSAAR
ncbi:PpiC-type peptidyl-prolyl cis-trans isomerase precursor [Bradyrhizobium oligotrophicum S58]|uniref:Parvulin-like PPIase n=1 Tax=Bradyrhizobium oligotrophicum S58 TaxID=1245469 RepID=M5A103_9BRAD|nr:peptidylprolyl isomerase [Bradyrhizobium oligotrophicum]BAM92495.1 PpiC-type peptidyl-prolyl cis-trans isomerase precursor [Bradyrhizobium oligotrophicum S58]